MKKKQITKFFFLLLYFCHVILLFLPRYNENFYSKIISIMINRNNIHLQSYFLHQTSYFFTTIRFSKLATINGNEQPGSVSDKLAGKLQ